MLLRHSGVMAAFDSITVAGAAPDLTLTAQEAVRFTGFPFHPVANLAPGHLKGAEQYQAPSLPSNEQPKPHSGFQAQ